MKQSKQKLRSRRQRGLRDRFRRRDSKHPISVAVDAYILTASLFATVLCVMAEAQAPTSRCRQYAMQKQLAYLVLQETGGQGSRAAGRFSEKLP